MYAFASCQMMLPPFISNTRVTGRLPEHASFLKLNSSTFKEGALLVLLGPQVAAFAQHRFLFILLGVDALLVSQNLVLKDFAVVLLPALALLTLRLAELLLDL